MLLMGHSALKHLIVAGIETHKTVVPVFINPEIMSKTINMPFHDLLIIKGYILTEC